MTKWDQRLFPWREVSFMAGAACFTSEVHFAARHAELVNIKTKQNGKKNPLSKRVLISLADLEHALLLDVPQCSACIHFAATLIFLQEGVNLVHHSKPYM